jgi:MFS family permease
VIKTDASADDGSLFNGLQGLEQWQEYYGNPSGNLLGLAGAALYLPSVVTAFVADYISTKYGRRWAIWIGSVIVIGGACVNSASTSFGMYIGGRAFMGVGSALCLTAGPALLQEVAHPRYRATIGGFYTGIYYIAAIISGWTCYAMIGVEGTKAFRIPCYLQILGPALVLILTCTCPESPRWLVHRGHLDEAKHVLAKYHANGDFDDPLVNHQMKEITAALADEEASNKVSYMDFLRTPANRRRLIVLLATSVGTNWVGNALVSYYLASILRSVGITSPTQIEALNGGLAIYNLFVSSFACLYVEEIGRRVLWLTSTIGMLVSYIVITGLSAGFAENGSKALGTAVIPMLFIFYGFYE